MATEGGEPLRSLQAALAHACCEAGAPWNTLIDCVNQHRQAAQTNLSQALGGVAQAMGQHVRIHQHHGPPMPALAVRHHAAKGKPVRACPALMFG